MSVIYYVVNLVVPNQQALDNNIATTVLKEFNFLAEAGLCLITASEALAHEMYVLQVMNDNDVRLWDIKGAEYVWACTNLDAINETNNWEDVNQFIVNF